VAVSHSLKLAIRPPIAPADLDWLALIQVHAPHTKSTILKADGHAQLSEGQALIVDGKARWPHIAAVPVKVEVSPDKRSARTQVPDQQARRRVGGDGQALDDLDEGLAEGHALPRVQLDLADIAAAAGPVVQQLV
jgi:hypothetical protein